MDHCNYSLFSQFFEKSQELQKSQFLLGTILPPAPLDLINFSKNCDFSHFFAIFGEIAEISVFAGHPCTSSNVLSRRARELRYNQS